jgi:hypothetical protein
MSRVAALLLLLLLLLLLAAAVAPLPAWLLRLIGWVPCSSNRWARGRLLVRQFLARAQVVGGA